MPTFRVEEELTLTNEDDLANVFDYRQYQCRYYEVDEVPDGWDTMPLAHKELFLRHYGSENWYYDENVDGDTSEPDKVISVERLDK